MIETLEEAIDFFREFLKSMLARLNGYMSKQVPPRELRKFILMWYFSMRFLSLLRNLSHGSKHLKELEKFLDIIYEKIKCKAPWEFFNEIIIIKTVLYGIDEELDKIRVPEKEGAHYNLLKSEHVKRISKEVSIVALYFILKYRKKSGLDVQKIIEMFKKDFRTNDEWIGDREYSTINDSTTRYFVYLILKEFDNDKKLLDDIIMYFQEKFDEWYNEHEKQLIINHESFLAYLVLKEEGQLYPIESVYLNSDPYREKFDLRSLFLYYVGLSEKAKIEYNSVEVKNKDGLKKFMLTVFGKIFSREDLGKLEKILLDPKNALEKIRFSPKLEQFLVHSILICRYERYGILINYPLNKKEDDSWVFPWEMDPKTFLYYHLALGLMAFLLKTDRELLEIVEKYISPKHKYRYVQERQIYGAFYPYELYKEKANKLRDFLLVQQPTKRSQPKFYKTRFRFYHLRKIDASLIEIYPKFLVKWSEEWDLRFVVTIKNEKLKKILQKLNEDLKNNRNHFLIYIENSEDKERFEIIRSKDSKELLKKLTDSLEDFDDIENIIIIKGDIKKFSMSVDKETFLRIIEKTCEIDDDSLRAIRRILNRLRLIDYYGDMPLFKGIPEGIPINPILLEFVFIILLYQAYISIKKNHKEGFIKVFVYNEDFVIISDNEELLRKYYESLKHYLNFVGWTISKEKTKIISLKRKKLADELGLPWGREFTYLGAKIKIEDDSPPYIILFDDKRLKRIKWYLATRLVNRLINLDMITDKLELEIYTKNGLIEKLKKDCESTFYDGGKQVEEIEQWLAEIAREALRFVNLKEHVNFENNKELWNEFVYQLAKKLRTFVREDAKVYIITDAAYNKQEKLAGYGILIQSPDERFEKCYMRVESGVESSQLAEANAILIGINLAKERFGEKPTVLFSDNKHIINAINRRGRIKNPKVRRVIEKIRTYSHIEFIYKPEKTELIRKVDIISKKALEQAKKGKLEPNKNYIIECPSLCS